MNDFARELLADFLEEARPLSDNIAETLLELEREWEDGVSGAESLRRLKSDLHTLKGNSGMMGLRPVEELTHRMEDVCAVVERRPELRGSSTTEILLEGSDALREMIRLAAGGELDADFGREPIRAIEDAIAAMETTAPQGGEAPREPAAKARRHADGFVDDVVGEVVRIRYDKLDRMLELVGEAIVSRSSIEESSTLLATAHDADEAQSFDRAMESLEKSLRGLQQTLIESRLVPVSLLFRKFTRSVRDQAKECGRSVRLVVRGESTTIDKAIIDRLGDPLLHLVRNAIAHGIESSAERAKAGKPAEGVVELAAEHSSDRVVISVSDDGRGLDEKKILARARALGLTAADGEREATAYIFQPGFSTAEGVSKLSGRGVGLDVVASTIQALGGTIGVWTTPGRGSSFRIELPLTLAVLRSLFVEVDDELYALPLSYIEESFELQGQVRHRVNHQQLLSWRGTLIPLLDTGELLETEARKERRFCVVLSVGRNRCGLLVDRLVGQREVVVKGLDSLLRRHETLSGITVLGDGRLVFILDAAEIASRGAAEAAAARSEASLAAPKNESPDTGAEAR